VFRKLRPRDTAIWGAVMPVSSLGSAVTYWQLDPWELSTTDPQAMRGDQQGSTGVSEVKVPAVDINKILERAFPVDGRMTLLNVDIEGISYEVLNSIDFGRFAFDWVLVERDSPYEEFSLAEGSSPRRDYAKISSLGPTDVYSRAGVG